MCSVRWVVELLVCGSGGRGLWCVVRRVVFGWVGVSAGLACMASETLEVLAS